MNAFNRKVKILTPLAFKIMFLGGIRAVTHTIQEDKSLRENVTSNPTTSSGTKVLVTFKSVGIKINSLIIQEAMAVSERRYLKKNTTGLCRGQIYTV